MERAGAHALMKQGAGLGRIGERACNSVAENASPPEGIVPVELGVPAPLLSHLLSRPQFPPLRTSQCCGIVNHNRGVSGGPDQAPKLYINC